MAKRHADNLFSKPLPNPLVPLSVIVLLGIGIGFLQQWAFGDPNRLLGGPPPPNEYRHLLQPSTPAPVTAPSPTPAVPPAPAEGAHGEERSVGQ